MGRKGSKVAKQKQKGDTDDAVESVPQGAAHTVQEPEPEPEPAEPEPEPERHPRKRAADRAGGDEKTGGSAALIQEQALRAVAQRGTVSECRALLRAEINVDAADPIDGFTALIAAVCHDRSEIVAALLNYGASTKHADRRGLTALHWAASFGHLDCVQELLSRRADPNATTRRFDTPLHLACKGLHTQCAVVLMTAGADPHCLNVIGETARDAVPAVSAQDETSDRGAHARELRGKIDEILSPRAIKHSPLRVLLSHRPDEAGPREIVQQLYLALERRGFAVELSELTGLPAELTADPSPAAEHTRLECCLAKLCDLVSRHKGGGLVGSVLRTIDSACLARFIHVLALGSSSSAPRVPRQAHGAPALALAAVTMEWLRRLATHAEVTMTTTAEETFVQFSQSKDIAAKRPQLWMLSGAEDAFIPAGCWELHYPANDLTVSADTSEAPPNIVLQYLCNDISTNLLQEMRLTESVPAAAERIQADTAMLSSKAVLELLICKSADAGPTRPVGGSGDLDALLLASLSAQSLATLTNLSCAHETSTKLYSHAAARVTQEVRRRISREWATRQAPESNAATDESHPPLPAPILAQHVADAPLDNIEQEDSFLVHLGRLDMQPYLDRLVALGIEDVDDLELLTILEDSDLQKLGMSSTQRDILVSSASTAVKDPDPVRGQDDMHMVQDSTSALDLVSIPNAESHRSASNLLDTRQRTAARPASVGSDRGGSDSTSINGDARDLETHVIPGTGVALVDGLSDTALVNVGSTLDTVTLRATLELLEDDRLSSLLVICAEYDTPAHRAVGNEIADQIVIRLCRLHSICTQKNEGDPNVEFQASALALLHNLSELAVVDLIGPAVSRAELQIRLETRRKDMRSSLGLPDDSLGRTGVGTYPVAISDLVQIVIEDLDRRESEHISTGTTSSAPILQESQDERADETQDDRPVPKPEPDLDLVADEPVTGVGLSVDAAVTAWRLLDVGSRIFGCDCIVFVVDCQTFGMTHQQARAFGESLNDSGCKLITRCELASCAAQGKPVVPILYRLQHLPAHLPTALSNQKCSPSFRECTGQMRDSKVVTKVAADAIVEEIHSTMDRVANGHSQWDDYSSTAVGSFEEPSSQVETRFPDERAEHHTVDRTTTLNSREPQGLETSVARSEPKDTCSPTTISGLNGRNGLTAVAFPELLLAKVEKQSSQLDAALKRIAKLEAKAVRQETENRRMDAGLARLDSELDRLTSYVHLSAGAGFHSDVRQYRPQKQQPWNSATVSTKSTAAPGTATAAAASIDVEALASRVEELSATFAESLSQLAAAATGEELKPKEHERPIHIAPEVSWQVEDPTDTTKMVTYSKLECAAITEAWLSGQKKLRLFPTDETPSRPAVEIELSDMTEKTLEPGSSRRTVLGHCDGSLIRFRDAPEPTLKDAEDNGAQGCWMPSSASKIARRIGAIIWEVQREAHGWWIEIKPSHQRRLTAAYLARITTPVLLDGGAYKADFVKMQWEISSHQQVRRVSLVEEDTVTEEASQFKPRLRGRVGTESVPKLVHGKDRVDAKKSAEAEQHAHLTTQLARKLSAGQVGSRRATADAAEREAAMMKRVEDMITDALQKERLERHRLEREQSEARKEQEKDNELRREIAAREAATKTIQRYVRGWSGRAYATRVLRRRTRAGISLRQVPSPS